jgi:hypothetical protein
MDVKKIYADAQNKGTVVCAQCGKTRLLDVSQFKHVGKPLKVKCSCSHTFLISIEARKFYRKPTSLVGEYIRISNDVTKGLEKGRMTIEDLSRAGLGFRTHAPHHIRVQDMLRLHFFLDDTRHSEVQKSAVVRRVNHLFVGAEFLDFDAFNEANRTLGLYLMPR